MKRCTKCGAEKALDEYQYRAGRTRRDTQCKECRNLALRISRRENGARWREYDRRQNQRPERKEWYKEKSVREAVQYRARQAANRAIKSGKLKRQPCESCGRTDVVHAHHDDYSKPLQVRWLCPIHHAAAHGKRIDT